MASAFTPPSALTICIRYSLPLKSCVNDEHTHLETTADPQETQGL